MNIRKQAGLAAIVVSFLGGCLAAIVDPEAVAWGPFALLLALGVAGVASLRLADRAVESNAEVLDGKMRDLRESIALIVDEAKALVEAHATSEPPPEGQLSTYDLPERIDARFPEPVGRFVDAREAIARAHGTQAYADIMGEFAAGERYLNRVWSASAEGYVDEASAYLKRACTQFERTKTLMDGLS